MVSLRVRSRPHAPSHCYERPARHSTDHDPALDRRVKSAGASKTVYALVTPETEAAKHAILGNAVNGPDATRRHHLEQFRDAWTGKQFASHEAFIERWTAWAAPVIAIDTFGYPWRYPTAGGSEAAVSCHRRLRQSRAQRKIRARGSCLRRRV
jgi:hypothetical protein